MIVIDNKKYYNADKLREEDSAYFYGCRGVRNIIEKRKIDEKYYVYAMYNKKKGWYISKSSRAKLLLRVKWVKKNIPKYNDDIENEIEEAPEILILEDEEKFKDSRENILEIEVRGEKNKDKCYFNAKDIEKIFNINRLRDSITTKTSNYTNNNHYKYFICKNINSNDKLTTSKKMFLTYKGVLKVLFSSRVTIAEHFIDWATDILFTVQMGTKKMKNKLVSDIMGVSAEAVKQVFKKSGEKFSCVYLFHLGNVKELREEMNIGKEIPNDHLVFKFGRTDDITRRTKEHIKTFEKCERIELKLKRFTYIDPLYVSDAEQDINSFFSMYGKDVRYNNSKEIVTVDPKYINEVEKRYKQIFNEYGGRTKELQFKVKELENKLELIRKDIIIRDGIIETKNKEIEMKNKEIEKNKRISELEKRVLEQDIHILKSKLN